MFYGCQTRCGKFLFIAVTNLAPGATYTMEVVAYKKKFTGQSASITVETDGKPLPKVSGLVRIEFVHACARACTLNEYGWYTLCKVIIVISYMFHL
jgi:hypothetical protein